LLIAAPETPLTMKDVVFYATAILVVCIILKFIFWMLIRKKSFKLFYRSFIRFYSVYDMHDAPSAKTLTFWKASNVINLLAWTAGAILIITGFLSINIFD
jgi:hypothetical protein